ncbi:MAG TPA: hypothetical protein VMT18_12575, partial [Planctomycetota bacterium]|nr:hypothetical protein [Planctomycetota bacterium]
EGLELADYAAREGLPLATVRSRHARALARLRERLDRVHGERREAWAVALAGLVGIERGGGGIGGGVAAGAVVMGTQAKLAGGLAAAIVLVLLARIALRPPDLPPIERGVAPRVALVAPTPELDSHAVAPTARSDVAREAIAAPERELTAVLRVVVRWPDGTPAAGVHVRELEWARPNPFLQERTAPTDERGIVEWDEVRPGGVSVYIDRGGSASLTVEAGATQEVALTIPRGIDVRGVVRDLRGTPVVGATIWLSPYGGSNNCLPVAESGPDGRFQVRDVENHHNLVARLAGRAPSPAISIEGSVGDVRELELILQGEGARIDLRVVDLEGRPVEGARVRATQGSHDAQFAGYPAGTRFGRRLAYDARSGVDGSVVIEGLAPEETQLIVAESSYGSVTRTVPLEAGRTTRIEVDSDRARRSWVTCATARARPWSARESPSVATATSTAAGRTAARTGAPGWSTRPRRGPGSWRAIRPAERRPPTGARSAPVRRCGGTPSSSSAASCADA